MISLILFSCLLSSCHENTDLSPSTLVLTIEGLSGSDFSCQHFEEIDHSGFKILCNEAVRFTHAFTPSPLAQAGIGSILTGKAPFLNELRDNGLSALSAKELTLPEKLITKNIRTFFIASAPTIKRYSRLHQGFELFHDEYELSPKNLYRPLSQSFQIFKTWMTTEVHKQTFFGIIHISDLLFPQIVTQNELFEPRAKGLDGQLEEIDENLYLLFSYLKQAQLWDKMHVILTGLNGTATMTRIAELPGNNLFTENVAIPLFMKPPKGREEIPLRWKIDSHVTLQDLGETIKEIYSQYPPQHDQNPLLYGVSLLSLLKGKSDPDLSERTILIESAWPMWNSDDLPRYSLRDGQWLYIYDQKPLLYNTMTDRNELNKVSNKDSSYFTISNQFKSTLDTIDAQPYIKNSSSISNEVRFVQLLVENEGRPLRSYFDELDSLIKNENSSDTIRWLTLDLLLGLNEWDLIKKLNIIWKDSLIDSILKLKANRAKDLEGMDPCLELIFDFNNSRQNSFLEASCQLKDILLLSEFLNANSDKKDLHLERLIPIIRHHILSLKIIYFDLSNGGTVLGGKNSAQLREIIFFKLILSLPQFQKDRALIEKHIGPK